MSAGCDTITLSWDCGSWITHPPRVPPTYRGRKASKVREARRDDQLPLGMRPGDFARASRRAMTTNDRRGA